MGFFSGLRKRVKKFIPKEIRPFVPYIAAGFSGPIGAKLGMSGLSSMYQKALIGGGARFLSDDEADLKDVGITAALAAAPAALESYGNQGMIGSDFAKSAAGKMVDAKGLPTLTTLAAQGGVDAGIKAAELNEDALDKYNRELAAQGIGDRTARRAAIRAIYEGTGTWDMDEVDGMLDTYGYRTGGRVGYMYGGGTPYQNIPGYGTGGPIGDMILQQKTYEDEEGGMPIESMTTLEEIAENARDKKDIEFSEDEEEGGMTKKKYENFQSMLGTAQEGLASLNKRPEPMRITPLTFAEGGSVDDRLMERVKELQDEGMDFASAMAQAMKEDMAQNKARGGVMDAIDVNMQEQIDTPRGDVMVDENIEVAQDMDMPIQDLAEEFEITFGRPAESLDELKMYYQQKYGFNGDLSMVEESQRTMAAEGGLMSMGGNEMDLRGGGFVPMGKAERADDVPARLSKNEFVMTADAVRAAGGGSVQKGADLMYDQMKQLEGQA